MYQITGKYMCVCVTTLPKATRLVDVHVIAIAFLSLSCKCNRNFCDLRHVTRKVKCVSTTA